MMTKNSVSNFTRSNNPILLGGLQEKEKLWVSATHTRNYMLNDTLVDWLKLQTEKSPTNTQFSKNTNTTFGNYILQRGIEFEDAVINYLKTEHPIISVSQYITDETCNKTIELMKQGVPIIHSAPVMNYRNKTKGVIDLLVRSDYLENIVEICPINSIEKKIPSPKLKKDYHYLVIDIKFSTIPLRADGIHILNSGSFPAYKSQLYIYTKAIAEIQGYLPKYAFILGRRWKFKSKDIIYRNYTCDNKLGVINFFETDFDYIRTTLKAIRWCRNVRSNGRKWSVNPPSRKELYPNMCRDSGKWQSQKKKIASEIGEITNIWYCGVKHRNIALNKEIKSWRDPKCVSKNIGINGKRSNVIDKILDINRQDIDLVRPLKIKNNLYGWKNNVSEIFVDFETLSDIFSPFDKLPKQKATGIIFMIGVYWLNPNTKKFRYTRFTCKNQTMGRNLGL